LDSAGRAGNIFLQNLAYKVVLSDANNNPIWTDDPVYSSDFSTRAKFLSGAGSPNGNTAGTAGSPGIGADTYWDATNNILYVCTQTGTASTAVWTAINSGASTSIVAVPQGYLTPISGTPVINVNSTVTTLYYTPFVGNTLPIYNGSSFVPTTFSELSLALSASNAASTLYDVFVFNNNGVLTLVTGPAWASSTAGSSSRGAGAGTTSIARINGLWVNSVSMTARNGSNTYSVAANQATYVGTLFIDGTQGQVSCFTTAGQSRKWGIWNAYNRQQINILVADPNSVWSGTSSTWIASHSNTNNVAATVIGLAEESISADFQQYVSAVISGAVSTANIGVGLNLTTSSFASVGTVTASNTLGTGVLSGGTTRANGVLVPSLGLNTFTTIEKVPVGPVANATYNGGAANMLMRVSYRG